MIEARRRDGAIRWLALLVAAVYAVYTLMHRLGSTSGSTAAERSRLLPGDELIDDPTLVTNHAAHLPAPPERVWPWLTQVG